VARSKQSRRKSHGAQRDVDWSATLQQLKREPAAAEAALFLGGPKAMRAVADELKWVTNCYQFWTFVSRALLLAVVVLALFLFRGQPINAPDEGGSTLWIGQFLLLLLALSLVHLALHNGTLYHDALTRCLQRSDDVSATGTLACALRNHTVDQGQVTAALARILPRLGDRFWTRLSSIEREALHESLSISPTEFSAYLISLLGALTEAGDLAAIPHVEHLIRRLGNNTSRLRVAASACLAQLEEMQRADLEKQTLLRSSDDVATLLTPARPPESDNEQLLRSPEA
jgi:hypothetical protein